MSTNWGPLDMGTQIGPQGIRREMEMPPNQRATGLKEVARQVRSQSVDSRTERSNWVVFLGRAFIKNWHLALG